MPLWAWLVLGPCLAGQLVSLLYYRRQCRPWDEVAPGVWIGRLLSRREAAEAAHQGITAVLDLTSEFSEAAPFVGTRYLNLPILDLTAPTTEQLRQAADFIAEERAKGTVYVHCKIGYSRSAAAVGAYLLASGTAKTVEEAIALLRKMRPSIIVRSEAIEALQAFNSTGR